MKITVTINLPQPQQTRNVRRERHLSRQHRDAISRGNCRHHDTKRFSITQPQWWMRQPATFAKAVQEAMIEGQTIRLAHALHIVANG